MPDLSPVWVKTATQTAVAGRKAPWVVLILGFGGLLACIVFAAVGTVGAFDRVRRDETRIRKSYMDRQTALDQIRSEIYLSGTYVRDYLLSPDRTGEAAQSSRLTTLEAEARAAVAAYSRALAPEEREPFRALVSEIDEYWRVLNRTVEWTAEERHRLRDSFFYDELVPRRTAMLQIADRIALVNERGLARSEEQLAASSDGLRRTLMATFGVTMIGGVVLAFLTIMYTLRLERQLERGLEENARSKADLQELSAKLVSAQENERRNLARELHDEVGQTLSAILMETGNAECAAGVDEMREHLAAVRSLAEKTVNEVRDLALLLRPSMLDDFGLAPALKWHAREMAKRTGLNILMSVDEDADELPDDHTTCIYRVVQEAINNCARHANARTIDVVVKREAGLVHFTVRDDGSGFDTRFVRGLGILGMEERVRRLGGRIRVDSQPGRGATVSAELPLVELDRKTGHDAHPHLVG